MSTETIPPADGPNALQDFADCPAWGQGGQFIYDPATKTRTRVGDPPAPAGVPTAVLQAEAAAADLAAPAEANQGGTTTVKTKERTRA